MAADRPQAVAAVAVKVIAVTKTAVTAIAKSAAMYCGQAGYQIRVNAILPGIIDTPRNRLDMPKADFTRWVSPEAIAGVIHFLASAEAAPVTGSYLPTSSDPLLAPVLQAMHATPGDNRSVADWASVVHTTERTLARRFRSSARR